MEEIKQQKQQQKQFAINILQILNIELSQNACYSEEFDDDVIDMYKINLLIDNKIRELEQNL